MRYKKPSIAVTWISPSGYQDPLRVLPLSLPQGRVEHLHPSLPSPGSYLGLAVWMLGTAVHLQISHDMRTCLQAACEGADDRSLLVRHVHIRVCRRVHVH